MGVTVKRSMREIFVVMKEFCILTELVTTQMYTWVEWHRGRHTLYQFQIPGFDFVLELRKR